MHVSAWAIRNPIPIAVLFILMMLAGFAGYRALPIKLLPDVSFPIVQVSVTLPGAAPTEVETQVTRLVESSVFAISGVRHVQSAVSLGVSSTTVEFEIGDNPQRATDEVRSALDRIRNELPLGIEQPVVQRLDLDDQPIVTYAVAAPGMADVDLSWFIDDSVSRRLIAAGGIAQVKRLGGVDREINVTLDPAELDARGVSAAAVNEALRSYNVDAPGGSAAVGGREQTVRVLGAAVTVDRLRETEIPAGAGRYVRLGDIAMVTSGAAARDRFSMLGRQPVVAFQVMKTKTASDVTVENGADTVIAALAREHRGVTFRKIISTAKNTRQSYQGTLHALIEGMVLAAVVVFLFLRDWRSTAIAAIAMPVSLIPTFAVMAWMGFSLNVISLLALTLVIGILVDDAIVEIENIEKRIEAGETPYQAALVGADAIGLAVIATTAAIVVVFLPVSMMGGYAGQFFREFGMTVSIAVLCSLVVARLLTPLLAAYLLRPSAHIRATRPFAGPYRRTIEWTLAHRWLSLGGATLLFLVSIALAATLPTGFAPASDNGIVNLTIEGAPGASLDDMRRAGQTLAGKLEADRDVDLVFTSVGAEGDPRAGNVTILLGDQRSRTTQAFQSDIRPLLASVPDVLIGGSQAGGASTLQMTLAGEDGDALARAAQTLEQQMRGIAGLANVHRTTARPGAELIVRPKPDEAARLGVTAEALAATIRVATIGDIDANTAKFNSATRRMPIRVRLPDSARSDLAEIRNLRIPLADGGATTLAAIADIDFIAGASSIQRLDRERRVVVEAELDGLSLGQALKQAQALPILRKLPAGVAQPAVGQTEDMMQSFSSFASAMAAGIAMILAVLVLLFRSFFKPVTILAALPLSFCGAFLGLSLGRSEIGLPALIGLLMLMGLAAKNSILLVEHAIESERAGMTQHEALLEACRERARPIVMTTVAMAAGMVPSALGLGHGSEFRVPMALAVIGGLISSTALSLVLVPVVYEVIDDFEMWLRPRLGRLVSAPGPEPEPGS
jgi:hydrophobic/amphiphilic exporter-1 (mainly G- bacteria), HAE1 family